jgi:hypothetical protein
MQKHKRLGIVTLCVLAVVLAGCTKKEAKSQSSEPTQAAKPHAASENTPAAQAAKTQAPSTEATEVKPAKTQTPSEGATTAPAAAPTAPSAEDYAKMAEQNRQNLIQMNKGKVIEAVSAATLKALLPAELPGMKRTEASGEKTQAMGVDMSTAEGRYEAADGGDASVSIKLTDVGNMSGPMRMGLAAWAVAQYSRETDTGYEKTTTYNGYKAMEEYNTESKHGSMRVLVADRFIVEADGHGVTIDTLKQVLGKIDLKKLAAAGS